MQRSCGERCARARTAVASSGLDAERREQADVLVAQPPEREWTTSADEDRAIGGRRARRGPGLARASTLQHVEKREPDGARVWSRLARLCEEQRDLERLAARRRQLGRDVLEHRLRADRRARRKRVTPRPRRCGARAHSRSALGLARRRPPRGSSCRSRPRRKERVRPAPARPQPETPGSSQARRPARRPRHSHALVAIVTVRAGPGCGDPAQSRIVTVPASPSTRSRSPVLIRFVAPAGADDSREPVLSRDDGGVAHDRRRCRVPPPRSCRRPASNSARSTARRGSHPPLARRAGRGRRMTRARPRPHRAKPRSPVSTPWLSPRVNAQPLLDALRR